MKRKKQGSSLIMVIIVFMVVLTVSTAMLSMVASNYKARATESKRIENLYASDSGLDVAYNIIGKTFDGAAKYANLKVNKMKALKYNSSDDRTSIYNQNYIDIQNDIKELEDNIKELQDISENLTEWNKNHLSEQKTQSDIENDIAKNKALIKEDKNIQEALCNEEFKRSFRNFIKKHTYKDTDPKYDEDQDDDGDDEVQNRLGLDEDAPNKLQESIEGHKYVNSDSISLDNINDMDRLEEETETINFNISNKNSEPPQLEASITESPVADSYEQTGISISNGHKYDVSFTAYENQLFDIAVTSTFYTEKVMKNGEENKINQRQLQSTYRMLVPNYKDIYFENTNGDLNGYLATKDRALTIFGDMNVNNVTGLTVNGDIFVKDIPDSITSDNRVFEKYFGGITLNNSSDINFEGNVITRGTFNIQNITTPAGVNVNTDITTKVDGDLYAKNIYIGKKDNSKELASGYARLDIKNVIINNDLALKANNAKINIGDLYGINDEDSSDKAESSSSIIVNGNSNSIIDIKNHAYLMGTAHIATRNELEDYQTAESGAVKGNYIAYSVPLTDDEKTAYNNSIIEDTTLTAEEKKKYLIPLDKSEKFAYHDPLQLLEPDKDDLDRTVQQAKENHFRAYWNQDGRNPSVGGIIWPHNSDGSIKHDNIWSIGAIIYQNTSNGFISQVIPSHYIDDLISAIDEELETDPEKGSIYRKRKEFAQYAYKFGQKADIYDYYDNIKINGSSLVNLANNPNVSEYTSVNYENKGEYAIINKSTKEIKITKSADNTDPNVINIVVGQEGVLNAVIATAGKVSIGSGITINGCVIAQGDLDINGDDVTINYNTGVIERVQAQNAETFKYVFGESIVADTNNSTGSGSGVGSTTTSYNLKNFLENKLWKILR